MLFPWSIPKLENPIVYKGQRQGINLSSLFRGYDEFFMWDCIRLAKFLNMSYVEVQNLPFDEYETLKRMYEIDELTRTEEGVKTLELNIRLLQTSPDVDKLRERYGGGD